MQVLILGDDHRQQARLAAAMMKTGFQVFCVESAAAAASYIRNELIDVLVLTETRSGRISQSCACVAQSRNRAVSVIVMSHRTGPAMEELFEELPQLYGVMGLDMAPAMVAALALASILPQQVETEVQHSQQARNEMPPAPPMQVDVAQYPLAAPVGTETETRRYEVFVPADDQIQTTAPLVRPAPMTGARTQISRTLIEPMRRPLVSAPAMAARIPSAAARPVSQPNLARAAEVPPARAENEAGQAFHPATLPVAPAPRWTGVSLSDNSDIGADLAALERELDLVNRDRPSVLAGSIAEELPRWSQNAPKLAMLTDWTTATPASTDSKGAAPPVAVSETAKARADRRLELGITLQ